MTTATGQQVDPSEAHVLVIEDNVSNNTTMLRLLTFAGVSARHCESRYSGSGATQFAESRGRRIDLVLLDLSLPEQSGYEVLRQLRSSPSFRGTRIVAVTGHNSVGEMRRAQAAGFDGFLGKPLLPERFVSQLARILKGESGVGASLSKDMYGTALADAENTLLKVHLALVQAKTEWDVLSALRLCADVETCLSLIYLELNDAGEPVQGKEVARLQGTLAWEPAPPAGMSLQAASPLIRELAERREPVWFVERALSPLRILPLSSDAKRLVTFKLYGAVHVDQEPRWHSVLLLTWPEPRAFERQEKYVFTSLWETLSVVVSNHRLRVEALDMLHRLQTLDRLKDEFLHMLSHELRTPVAAIITAAELTLSGIDGQIDERARRNVESIGQSGEHLLSIVNDLLDMASIEADTLCIDHEAVDAASLCYAALEHIAVLAQEKGLQIVVHVADDLLPIWCDRRRIVQVLLNLLSNAVKFTEKGVICLSGRAHADEVVLSVRDDGPGIHPDYQAVIFEKFRQVDGSLARRGEGTGLGLPIAKHLVELHGGRIWLESVPGVGSCFSFSLPCVRSDDEHSLR